MCIFYSGDLTSKLQQDRLLTEEDIKAKERIFSGNIHILVILDIQYYFRQTVIGEGLVYLWIVSNVWISPSWVLPMGPLQFFMNCSSMGSFHGVKSFRNRLSLFPSKVTSPARKPVLVWVCHRVTTFFQASTCSGVGPSMSCWGISALASGALPPSSLSVCRAVSVTYAHFSLLGCNCCYTGIFFFPFFKYQRHLALLLMGSTLDSSGSIGHRQSCRSHCSQ